MNLSQKLRGQSEVFALDPPELEPYCPGLPIPRIMSAGLNFLGVPVMWSLASVMILVRTSDDSLFCSLTRPQGETLSETQASEEPSFRR